AESEEEASLACRLVEFCARLKPIMFRPLQRICCGCARFRKLGRLFRIAREDVGQRERCVDFLDDTTDAGDLGLSAGDLLFERRLSLRAAALRPVTLFAALTR